MLKYLRSLHQLRSSPTFEEYTVVAGNQAADMDSCCSALIAAFVETKHGSKAIPLIDIPRKDLSLRKDIIFVFKSLGINSDWLIFSDDIKTTNNTSLFLVDHNHSTIPGTIKSVIDHHAVEATEAEFKDADPKVIIKSGSCMSAVLMYYTRGDGALKSIFEEDNTLAPLALSPILIDTANMTHKVEDTDREAVKFLSQFKFPVFSPIQSFSTIMQEKKNITGLSTMELLRKDYKQWDNIGISSLPKLFDKLRKVYGVDDLAESIVKYRKEEELAIVIALANGTKDGIYIRELAYSGPAEFDIVKECPDLDLDFVYEDYGTKFYNQRNTLASRKQVAPQVRKAYVRFTHSKS